VRPRVADRPDGGDMHTHLRLPDTKYDGNMADGVRGLTRSRRHSIIRLNVRREGATEGDEGYSELRVLCGFAPCSIPAQPG
jgi:hypothetical protein